MLSRLHCHYLLTFPWGTSSHHTAYHTANPQGGEREGLTALLHPLTTLGGYKGGEYTPRL